MATQFEPNDIVLFRKWPVRLLHQVHKRKNGRSSVYWKIEYFQYVAIGNADIVPPLEFCALHINDEVQCSNENHATAMTEAKKELKKNGLRWGSQHRRYPTAGHLERNSIIRNFEEIDEIRNQTNQQQVENKEEKQETVKHASILENDPPINEGHEANVEQAEGLEDDDGIEEEYVVQEPDSSQAIRKRKQPIEQEPEKDKGGLFNNIKKRFSGFFW